jgi:hypothetical protein
MPPLRGWTIVHAIRNPRLAPWATGYRPLRGLRANVEPPAHGQDGRATSIARPKLRHFATSWPGSWVGERIAGRVESGTRGMAEQYLRKGGLRSERGGEHPEGEGASGCTFTRSTATPFDYLTELQKHAEEPAKNPAVWMPWNYSQALRSASLSKDSA